jgi:microcystin-dependent protein
MSVPAPIGFSQRIVGLIDDDPGNYGSTGIGMYLTLAVPPTMHVLEGHGQMLSIGDFPDLFATFGYLYGGFGTHQFGIPQTGSSVGIGNLGFSDPAAITAARPPLRGPGPAIRNWGSHTVNYIISTEWQIGSVQMYAGCKAPAGFVLCDGTVYGIADPRVGNLFLIIGNTFGGDGMHTFAVPDLRGRMIIGAGPGSSHAIGQKTEFSQETGFASLGLLYIMSTTGIADFPAAGSTYSIDQPYFGQIVAWAGQPDQIPSDWVPCDGRMLDAFSLYGNPIGNTYGGDVFTVGVPNLMNTWAAGWPNPGSP